MFISFLSVGEFPSCVSVILIVIIIVIIIILIIIVFYRNTIGTTLTPEHSFRIISSITITTAIIIAGMSI